MAGIETMCVHVFGRASSSSCANYTLRRTSVDIWVVALLRHGGGTINWKVDELKKYGQNNEKEFGNVWSTSSKE